MSLVEDRAAYFADFGIIATIGGSDVTVIFDNEFLASMDVESSNPMAMVNSADLEGVSHGAPVLIESINYKVVGIHPDGTGFSALELGRV